MLCHSEGAFVATEESPLDLGEILRFAQDDIFEVIYRRVSLGGIILKKIARLQTPLVILAMVLAFVLSCCGKATQVDLSTSTPESPEISATRTLIWIPEPTSTNSVLTAGALGYTHYTPAKDFGIHLEFDFPSSWVFREVRDSTEILTISLLDSRFLLLPTPVPSDSHPRPNDFGSVYIWTMPSEVGQTPISELEAHKSSYNQIHRMKVLGDYKATIDGYEAYVLEYQVDDPETSPSLMFNKRTYFMVNGQVCEIIFEVAEKDRGGEFEQGYEYFFNSLKVIP